MLKKLNSGAASFWATANPCLLMRIREELREVSGRNLALLEEMTRLMATLDAYQEPQESLATRKSFSTRCMLS